MSKINVGTIGHGKTTLTAALTRVCAENWGGTVSAQPIVIRKPRGMDEPIFYTGMQRKSKGDKRRDRSERQRKWGI